MSPGYGHHEVVEQRGEGADQRAALLAAHRPQLLVVKPPAPGLKGGRAATLSGAPRRGHCRDAALPRRTHATLNVWPPPTGVGQLGSHDPARAGSHPDTYQPQSHHPKTGEPQHQVAQKMSTTELKVTIDHGKSISQQVEVAAKALQNDARMVVVGGVTVRPEGGRYLVEFDGEEWPIIDARQAVVSAMRLAQEEGGTP